jgi:hypothetical protein
MTKTREDRAESCLTNIVGIWEGGVSRRLPRAIRESRMRLLTTREGCSAVYLSRCSLLSRRSLAEADGESE